MKITSPDTLNAEEFAKIETAALFDIRNYDPVIRASNSGGPRTESEMHNRGGNLNGRHRSIRKPREPKGKVGNGRKPGPQKRRYE